MNANEPAFPQPHHYCKNCGTMQTLTEGISLRAHFAELAMQGLLSNPKWTDGQAASTATPSTAQASVRLADALIAELNKT